MIYVSVRSWGETLSTSSLRVFSRFHMIINSLGLSFRISVFAPEGPNFVNEGDDGKNLEVTLLRVLSPENNESSLKSESEPEAGLFGLLFGPLCAFPGK